MSRTIRTSCARALAAAVAACGILVIAAPAASADPKIPFTQDVYARTHLAKSGLDITVPPGQFDGTIDLATGEETGTLTLPPATVTMNLFGVIPVADASFVMAPAGPITGHVDLATFAVDTTASFNVKLAKLTPHGTNLNLVGDGCTTMSPISVRMQGVVNPATGGTFASTYTIPQFQDCGLLTPVISALVSGPGNTFIASFAPHGSPPPPAPSDPGAAPPAPPLGDDRCARLGDRRRHAGRRHHAADRPARRDPGTVDSASDHRDSGSGTDDDHLAGSAHPLTRPPPSTGPRTPAWASVSSWGHCSGAADATHLAAARGEGGAARGAPGGCDRRQLTESAPGSGGHRRDQCTCRSSHAAEVSLNAMPATAPCVRPRRRRKTS